MARPVIKWVGGKTQLLNEIKNRMPESYNRYYEPFFGGGAVFFEVAPKRAVINDFNSQLIGLYKWIKEYPDLVKENLQILQDEYNTSTDKATRYYEARDSYNRGILDGTFNLFDATQFIFLNKTCFNGLYRVNKKGLFNSPWGKKEKINLFDSDNIDEVAELLKSTLILNGDFADACKTAEAGDFVFFDSPYYDTFDTYQKGGFSEEDHRRLAKLFDELTQRGVKCMLTNSNTEFIKDLYKNYNIEVVPVKRMINRNGNNRVGEEVIITNY